jgi:hypothetical protein
MNESINAPLKCDVCDRDITTFSDHCALYIQGIREKLNMHASCVDIFYLCKGDFTCLPEGRLKRALLKASDEAGNIIIRKTGKTLRNKHIKHIKDGLNISHEEGYRRIKNLAVDFYGLTPPLEENGEFYSIGTKDLQIILLRKATPNDIAPVALDNDDINDGDNADNANNLT